MTYVATGEVTNWSVTTSSLDAGDLVVAVVGVTNMRKVGGGAVRPEDLAAPAGWVRAWVGSLGALNPWTGSELASVVGVFWRRTSGAGTLSATFGAGLSGNQVVEWVAVRGPVAIDQVVAARMNSQDFQWSALSWSGPQTGHVFHVGFSEPAAVGTLSPAGSTLRQDQPLDWYTLNPYGYPGAGHSEVSISEKAVTSVTTVAAATAAGYRTGGWTITLSAVSVAGPDAPTITAPSSPTVDLAAGFTIGWTPSGVQTGYVIRRRTPAGSGTWYYLDGSGNWSSTTEVKITSTATSYAVPAAKFTNASTVYDIQVATVGDVTRPDTGVYAGVVVTGIAPPTLSTATVAPVSSGNVTSLTPTVTLSGAAGSGGTFTGYRVRVDHQGPDLLWSQVLDSGVVSSPWTVSVAQAATLQNGRPIRFRSVSVQNGSQESATVTTGPYTLNAPTPAAPTITVTPITHPTSGLPGYRVSVASPTTGTAQVARNGVVIFTDDISAGYSPDVDDYNAGTSGVTYTARVVTGDGVTTVLLIGPWAAASPVSIAVDDSHCWIVDRLYPAAAVRAHVVTESGRGVDLRAQAFAPLGQSSWVVQAGVATNPTGSRTVTVGNPSELSALLDMLRAGRELIQYGWAEKELDNPGGPVIVDDLRFRPVGEPAYDHRFGGVWYEREVSFSFVQVPSGAPAPTVDPDDVDGGAPYPDVFEGGIDGGTP